MKNDFNFTAAALGSFPHQDTQTACQLTLDYFPEIPFWPQLLKTSFYESMIPQFTEKLPGIIIEPDKNKIWLDSNKAAENIDSFYKEYADKNTDYFAISPDYAKGYYAMKERIKSIHGVKYFKGHITGPITFGLNLPDESGKAIIHNELLFDLAVKTLTMKALWQVKEIKKLGFSPIIFLDEPSLMQYGSAYMPVEKDVVVNSLTEIISALHAENALVGIHCCGNTDWSLLLGLPIDILSFDAYGFIDKIALYPDKLNSFLSRNGIVAWGLIPTIGMTGPVTPDDLVKHLQKGISALAKKGVNTKLLANQSLLTPSCGLGPLSEEETLKRLILLKETGNLIKSTIKY
jgi:methionine synthase II (cobalamin-independent)